MPNCSMPGFLRSKINMVLVCLVFAGSPAYAESAYDPYGPPPAYDANADWCTETALYAPSKTKFVPNGAITRVGPYFFRVCQGGSRGSTAERRVMRFFYNPQRVEGLSSVKAMTGLMINALSTWPEKEAQVLNNRRLTGHLRLGGHPYSVFRYVSPLTGELGPAIYRFDGAALQSDSPVPPHFFQCTQSVEIETMVQGRCFLSVGYGDIWASLLFLSSGENDPAIPVDRFPLFARDIGLILKIADVSADLDSYAESLPFLD